MKKLIWLLIITFFIPKVYALETYYSEYSDFSDYQEEQIISSDTVNVETKETYKWCKEEKVMGDYQKYLSKVNVSNDCYETEYSDWSDTKPATDMAMTVDTRNKYNYRMIDGVRYIHLYDLYGSYGAIRFTEIQILYNDKKIDYNISCKGCWENFSKYIKNDIYTENMSYIDNGGALILDLGDYYPINKLKIILYLFDITEEEKKYTIGYSKDKENVYISRTFNNPLVLNYYKDSQKFEYNFSNFNTSDDIWLTNKISYDITDNEYVYDVKTTTQYRYKYKYCRYYNIEKKCYPGYSENSIDDYTIKDEAKLFYRSQSRDKLILNMHDITTKNYDLNNFVIENTSKYIIENNIDWNKNGTYKVKYIMNNLVVEKDVNVNILSNVIEEKDKEINKLKQELNTLNEDYETKLNKINTDILNIYTALNNSNEDIKNIDGKLTNEINKYILELNNLKNDYQVKLDNIKNNISIQSDKLKQLQDSLDTSNSKINEIKSSLEEYITKYEEEIKRLDTLNTKINEIDNNINLIIDNYKELNYKVDNNYEELITSIETLLKDNKNNSSEINKIKISIKEIETKIKENSNKINNLENKDIEHLKELDNLNQKIDVLYEKATVLNSNDTLQLNKIILLQEAITNSEEEYSKKIEELNNINSNNLKDISVLNQKILDLNKSLLESDNNNLEIIESIKNLINQYNEEYNNKINNLETFNNLYLEKLKDIELTLNMTNNKFKELELSDKTLSDKQEVLDKKIEESNTNLKNIESINSDYINKFIVMDTNLNDINKALNKLENNSDSNYNELINYFKEMNDNYNNRFNELNNIINELKNNTLNKEDIIDLSNNDTKLEEVKKETVDLNTKLNDYVLRINGVEVINLVWLYIFISVLIIAYIIYFLKKKSNKKNN